jgi:hypothetical protein
MSDALDSPTLVALSPSHVGGYLRTHGWMDDGAYGAFGRMFHREIDSYKYQVVLPTRASIADFSRRMAELVESLADAESRPARSVLFDLTLTPFDVIRVRSKGADDYGSVRIADGVQLHEEARNLLVSAARAAIAEIPKKAYRGRRPDKVNEYLDRVRLGQTEKSSFSITILSPYSFDPTGEPLLLGDDAFGRRVTLKFAKALAATETALAEATGGAIAAFERRIGAGVSAELCLALGRLADSDFGTEVSVTWSPARPISDPVRLSLTRQDGAVLQEVAREFAREEPERDAIIEGIITQIAEEPHTFDGSATMEAAIEGRLRRVHIVGFGTDDRELLIAAFRKRKRIQVDGNLALEGRRLKLAQPRGLVVLDDRDAD